MRKAKIKAEEKIRMSSTKQVYDRLNDLIIGAGIPICANQLEIDFPDEILLARQNTILPNNKKHPNQRRRRTLTRDTRN